MMTVMMTMRRVVLRMICRLSVIVFLMARANAIAPLSPKMLKDIENKVCMLDEQKNIHDLKG